jgi:hypothetical protein
VVKIKGHSKKLSLPPVDLDPDYADDIAIFRLAKEGYWGGDPERIRNAPVDLVMETLWFEDFSIQFEKELYELNKDHE